MSSRHRRLSNAIDALMRVISWSGPLPNRPPQVRCGSRCEGGLSAIGRRVAMSVMGGQTAGVTDRRILAARQALKEGRTDAAAAVAEQVLGDDPDNIDALEIRALVGDDVTVEAALRRAMAIAPERRWPYADLTRLLLKLRRAEEAEQVARTALAADPQNPDAHAMLGSMLA